MLRARGGGVYYGDKGYVDDEWRRRLRAQAGVEMIAMRRKNQIVQLPEELQRQMARVRQIIETVNSQLVEQMHIQRRRIPFWDCVLVCSRCAVHSVFCSIDSSVRH